MLIQPHGNILVNTISSGSLEWTYSIRVSEMIESDIYNIWYGVYSPLDGFLGKSDFMSVLENMRLSDNTVWPIPIVLDISKTQKDEIKSKWHETISLVSESSWNIVAVLHVGEIYGYDKELFAQKVFWTIDKEHPGVWYIYEREEFLISGKIEVMQDVVLDEVCSPYWFTPKELRQKFEEKKWTKVVAFQTRNPPHRSHEYLQKCALENCDGLLIHPVVWKKKKGDFNDDYILWAYNILTQKYYKEDTTLLSVLPITMRYAGPREAVLHAIIRQNFGCSHMIVWRDHAGVGDYYGTYDAQNIFDQFSKEDLQIEVLKYEHAGYCNICEEVTSNKTCPHGGEYKLFISGTKIREKIKNKEPMPNEFIRKEVLDFLEEGDTQFVN